MQPRPYMRSNLRAPPSEKRVPTRVGRDPQNYSAIVNGNLQRPISEQAEKERCISSYHPYHKQQQILNRVLQGRPLRVANHHRHLPQPKMHLRVSQGPSSQNHCSKHYLPSLSVRLQASEMTPISQLQPSPSRGP